MPLILEKPGDVSSSSRVVPSPDRIGSALAYSALFLLSSVVSAAAILVFDQRDLLRHHVNQECAQISWVVFLKESVDKGYVEEFIRSFPGIRSIRFVSKQEVYDRAQQDPVFSKGLTFTGRNPFPESFEVLWGPFFLRSDFLAHVTQKVSPLEGVAQVDYDQLRVESLTFLQRILYQLDLILQAFSWIGALLLVTLGGRLLFFPQGLFPKGKLLAGVLSGFLGGTAGSLVCRFWMPFSWGGVLVGTVVGLLMVLWRIIDNE